VLTWNKPLLLLAPSLQIFIGYVLKQLELIEDGLIKKVEKLIPKIFQFVVLLSYERYVP
jgi:huntingtin